MVFEKANFIKPQEVFQKEFAPTNPSVIFVKSFSLDEIPQSAVLRICALGIGYAYINGKRVSEDLFTAPPSDYEKRLWYVQYPVQNLLKKGKNVLSVFCGNGFLSEDMQNGWSSAQAAWRDFPKVIAEVVMDGELAFSTDETWQYSLNSPYLMNRYRLGVTYDSRIPAPDSPSFAFENWGYAKIDERAPQGELTLYESEPIRELKLIEPVSIVKRGEKSYIVDFGLNMSGYARLITEGKAGDEIKLRYAETLAEDGSLYEEESMSQCYFQEGDFATERFICNGQLFKWSTLFSYYGFRYVEITCEDFSAIKEIFAVFAAQDIKLRSSFECSDPFLNKLFACGIQSTRCNLFYMPTDCPTREKYGWMNDAQASSEQILTDFHAEKMFLQWNVNICDALTDDMGLSGIVPTHGWGYEWGNGPVSDGSMFEHVYRVYLHSGNKEGLLYNLPYFKRYFAYLKSKEDENGFIPFGLYDWANPRENVCITPLELINAIYMVKFNRIAALAARFAGEDDSPFLAEEKWQKELIKKNWILPDGSCSVHQQTAVAMLIYHGLYEDLEPLKAQLKKTVEENDFHHDCGMVGLRHLYMALNTCGLQEYAMRIVTAAGYPSYRDWLDRDATTLWEMWHCGLSRNHQMFSDVLSWLMKTVAGISPNDCAETFDEIEIKPYFFESLSYAKAHYDSPKGRVAVEWVRENGNVKLKITAPCEGYVRYGDKLLEKGTVEFSV